MSHETLRSAYETLTALESDFHARCQRIIRGDKTANDGMPEVIAKMRAAFAAFEKEGESIRTRK